MKQHLTQYLAQAEADEAAPTERYPAPRISEVRLRVHRPPVAHMDIVVAPLRRDPRSDAYEGPPVPAPATLVCVPPYMVYRRT